MGGGGESRIWPKERWFPCEKLIDGRGSAFCKLVPHNFGQDCMFAIVSMMSITKVEVSKMSKRAKQTANSESLKTLQILYTLCAPCRKW